MVKATIVPAQLSHIPYIVEAVREADIRELLASSGRTPAQAIENGLKVSVETWTVLYDGRPVAIAGVAAISVLCGMACPWMIATKHVDANPVPFLRKSREYVKKMREWYPVLMNFVDARNAVAIRYLQWLGFDFHPPQPYGVSGRLFHPFEMRAEHV